MLSSPRTSAVLTLSSLDYISKMPISPTTTSLRQQDPIVGQQKAKEFSCHTPLTKDADRGDAPKNRKRAIADR
jgi:hypothetical protein